MNPTITTILIIIITLFGSINSNAQKYTFGKVGVELLKLTKCDIDENAKAMMTYKSGTRTQDVRLNNGKGMVSKFEQKIQIKIFNEDAKNLGTVSFLYFSPKDAPFKVKIKDIKGKTYNLIGDKIEVTKVKKENIFELHFLV